MVLQNFKYLATFLCNQWWYFLRFHLTEQRIALVVCLLGPVGLGLWWGGFLSLDVLDSIRDLSTLEHSSVILDNQLFATCNFKCPDP